MAKNFLKKAVITGVLIGSFFILPAVFAVSDTSTPANSNQSQEECKLQDAFDILLKVKDSDSSLKNRDQTEINARKDVVKEIIICSNLELDAFKKRLGDLNLKDNDKKDELLKNKFLGAIDAAKSYFTDLTNELSHDLDISGVKKLAQDLSIWRDIYYTPTLTGINDFALVIQNQQAIKTARTRFDKISFSLSAVKLNEVQEIKNLLASSNAHIKKGIDLNTQAHNLIWNTDIVAYNASSSPTSTEMNATTSVEDAAILNSTSTAETSISTESRVIVLPLIKDSLSELKKAYADYILISNIVKKYLGL